VALGHTEEEIISASSGPPRDLRNKVLTLTGG
jgi:hypothetical protein